MNDTRVIHNGIVNMCGCVQLDTAEIEAETGEKYRETAR